MGLMGGGYNGAKFEIPFTGNGGTPAAGARPSTGSNKRGRSSYMLLALPKP